MTTSKMFFPKVCRKKGPVPKGTGRKLTIQEDCPFRQPQICRLRPPFAQRVIRQMRYNEHSDCHGNGCCNGFSPYFPHLRTAKRHDIIHMHENIAEYSVMYILYHIEAQLSIEIRKKSNIPETSTIYFSSNGQGVRSYIDK